MIQSLIPKVFVFYLRLKWAPHDYMCGLHRDEWVIYQSTAGFVLCCNGRKSTTHHSLGSAILMAHALDMDAKAAASAEGAAAILPSRGAA